MNEKEVKEEVETRGKGCSLDMFVLNVFEFGVAVLGFLHRNFLGLPESDDLIPLLMFQEAEGFFYLRH